MPLFVQSQLDDFAPCSVRRRQRNVAVPLSQVRCSVARDSRACTALTALWDCRSKGLTENALAALGYSDTIIFRPALLAETKREDSRIAESVAS